MSERLKQVLADAVSERAELAKKSDPLKAKRDELRESISGVTAQIYDLTQQIKVIEGTRLVELDKEIGVLHRALGAKSLSAESHVEAGVK